MGKMYLLYEDSEEKLFWNESVPEEITIAQAQFEEYLKKAYIVCKIEKNGERGVQISEFDPMAEEIIFLPMLEGG